MKLLEDNDIRLRAVEPEDARSMWEMENDSEQWIHNGMAAPYSLQNLEQYANTYDADPIRAGQLRLIIERIEDKTILGAIDLYNVSAIHQTAFVGIYIFPPYRNKRYALKSIVLLEEYCRLLLNIYQLGAKILSDNKVSIRLFENAGYELRGGLPEWYKSGKTRMNLLLYSKIL